MDPRTFINDFGVLGIPPILYEGIYGENLIEKVRQDNMPKKLDEGIVAKGSSEKKVWMAKIKTNKWLKERL